MSTFSKFEFKKVNLDSYIRNPLVRCLGFHLCKNPEHIRARFSKEWDRVISTKCQIKTSFFIKNKDKITDQFLWDLVSVRGKLKESDLDALSDKLNWIYVSNKQKLYEKTIFKYLNKIDIKLLQTDHLSQRTRNLLNSKSNPLSITLIWCRPVKYLRYLCV